MIAQLSLFDDTIQTAPPAQINFIKADKPTRTTDTLANAIEAFLHAQATGGKSKYTIKAYRSDFKHVANFIGENTPIETIDEDTLNRFLNDRAKQCRPKTLERSITSLRSFFAWLSETNAIVHNPAAAVQYQERPETMPTLPTTKEMQAIIAAASAMKDPRPLALISLCLATGLKKGELMRLQLGDVTRDSVVVRYTNPKLLWKSRRLPLPAGIAPALWRYREAYPQTDATNRWFPFGEKTVELAIARAGYAAGLSFSLTAETLRWLYAVRQSKAGINPATLRENLGLSAIAWHLTWKKIKALGRLYG